MDEQAHEFGDEYDYEGIEGKLGPMDGLGKAPVLVRGASAFWHSLKQVFL